MRRLILTLPILLAACGHTPPKPEVLVVPRMEYVIKLPPAETMKLPAKPAKIDVGKPDLKQSEISAFMISSEDYVTQLENKLIEIAKFFSLEQQKLDEQAKKENSK